MKRAAPLETGPLVRDTRGMDHTTQEPEPPSRPDAIETRWAEMSRRMQEALLDELDRHF